MTLALLTKIIAPNKNYNAGDIMRELFTLNDLLGTSSYAVIAF